MRGTIVENVVSLQELKHMTPCRRARIAANMECAKYNNALKKKTSLLKNNTLCY